MESANRRAQCLLSEAIGTAFLLLAVVGSGIMAEKLAGGNVAIALLANAIATGAALVALISALGGISAQFNPAVTLMFSRRDGLRWRDVAVYALTQTCGALAGVGLANSLFGLPVFSASETVRSSPQ